MRDEDPSTEDPQSSVRSFAQVNMAGDVRQLNDANNAVSLETNL